MSEKDPLNGHPHGARRTAHSWVRQNILGLVAIFIALSGSAIAAQVASQPNAGTAKKKKVKRGPAGPPGLQGLQGQQGIPGPPGPSTGPAGGDLAGTYPDPTIAAGAVGPAKLGTTPAVRVFNTANQNVPAGSVFTDLAFDSEQFDTAAMHDTSANTGLLTAPIAGIYEVSAWIQAGFAGTIDDPPPSLSAIILASNGARVADAVTVSQVTNTVLNLSGLLRLGAGDTVKLTMVNANSTTAGVIGNSTAGIPALSMAWIGPPGP